MITWQKSDMYCDNTITYLHRNIYAHKEATFSIDKRYRYMLKRVWVSIMKPEDAKIVNWIMLNPSTADHLTDDATIRACNRVSRDHGYEGMVITNLYAVIETDSDKVFRLNGDRIGEPNEFFINKALSMANGHVVFGWGRRGIECANQRDIVRILTSLLQARYDREPQCIGITLNNQPRHPLYASKKAQLRSYFS